MRLSKLETIALQQIVRSRADGRIIEQQVARAGVDQRQRYKHGFRTFLSIDPVGRHLDKALWKTEHMPVVHAGHPALAGGARFTLVLADGFVSCLVGDSGTEPWPRDPSLFTFDTD